MRLVLSVVAMLWTVPVNAAVCPPADRNADGRISIDELVAVVKLALDGCPIPSTPTPTPIVSNRFQVNPNTIKDRQTGLVWEKQGWDAAYDLVTWPEALAHVDTLNARRYGGFNDWRLPTVADLRSIDGPANENGNHDVAEPFREPCSENCRPETCSCGSTIFYWTGEVCREATEENPVAMCLYSSWSGEGAIEIDGNADVLVRAVRRP